MSNKDVKIIECPRDAMQGFDSFVPTDLKIEYLNDLLQVGYHTIDCGSFVSPKAIPQMRDTVQVLDSIQESASKLSVIVANRRGIEEASAHERVDYLGYPFSISETFQQRNTNKSIQDSLSVVDALVNTTAKANKEVVVYISMGFGNNYGDFWHPDVVHKWVDKLSQLGVTHFSISDTVGVSNKASVEAVFKALQDFSDTLEFGAHFHTTPDTWREKVHTAWVNGCRRFDGAIKGFGGCPMAEDKLVGNMPTENLIQFFEENQIDHGLDMEAFNRAAITAGKVFG